MNLMPAPLLWHYTAAEIRRRPGRSVLTLLGIVIGVAATVAISVTVQTSRGAHRELFETVSGRAALEVVAEGLSGFDPDTCAHLQAVAGVQAALPIVQQPAVILGKSGAVPVLVLGIDPARDEAARHYRLHGGQPLSKTPGVWLEQSFGTSQGFALGKSARFLASNGFLDLPVAGLLAPYGAATFNGGAIAFMPRSAAQRLFALQGQVNCIQLVLADGAAPETVEAAVRRELPPGLTVQIPAARSILVQDSLLSTEQALATLSACALVAGAFVILNTFLMSLGERRRQLAILRALGATRRQVMRLLLREALLLGSAGTVLGIVSGMVLALGLRGVMARLLSVTLPELHWTSEPFLLAVAVGPGMALAAAYFPARRAGRRSVLHDLRARQASATESLPPWPGYLGLALLPISVVLTLGIPLGWYDNRTVVQYLGPIMALFLIVSMLILPLLLAPLIRLAAVLLRWLLGSEGSLAVRQLDRHRLRTTLTAGVLCIAVLFAVAFGQSLESSLAHARDWFEHVAYADFYVRGAWPDLSMSISTVALPETMAAEIAALDGVARVGKFRYLPARAHGRPIMVLAWTFPPERPLPLPLVDGEPAAVARGLARGEAVLGTALAGRLGVGVGDTFRLETRHGPQSLRVAGTATEYSGGGMAVYLEWATAQRCFDLQGCHWFLVSARPGAAPNLAGRLQAFCQERGLLLQSNAENHASYNAQLAGVVGFMRVLMVLVFVVAAFGIVNTLTMNVLEQSRELAILRAIGMRRAQLGRLILAQALALALISLLPGVCLGSALAYLINLTTYPLVGQRIAFQLDAALVLGCAIAAVGITVLAALIPARRAARVQVAQALQQE